MLESSMACVGRCADTSPRVESFEVNKKGVFVLDFGLTPDPPVHSKEMQSTTGIQSPRGPQRPRGSKNMTCDALGKWRAEGCL